MYALAIQSHKNVLRVLQSIINEWNKICENGGVGLQPPSLAFKVTTATIWVTF